MTCYCFGENLDWMEGGNQILERFGNHKRMIGSVMEFDTSTHYPAKPGQVSELHPSKWSSEGH